ncbi:MAG: recombinase family protein [Bdellovibrionales bacterium]
MKRIGIYLRVSTEEQARIQDGSLVSQRARLIEYVEGQNRRDPSWGTIIDFYLDDKSAKDMNRPQFQRMLHDVRTERIDLILSTELSRLSRSLKDFCEVWDLFKKHSTGFITLREQFDTTTAAGEMMVFNLMNFAQYERKQTAERISANWLSRAKRGLFNGGQVPLGFDRNPRNPGELLLHPTESKVVREIFEIFLEVGSVRETCRELSRRGIFSKHYFNKHGLEKGGGHMTVPSLFRILTDKAYIGLREFAKSKTDVDIVKASWPAMVDVEVFNRVQERLSKNKNKFKPDKWKRYPYPLTELLVCGECGKKLGGKSAHGKNRKHHYYGHPRQLNSDGVTHLERCRIERVRAERIEDILLTSLRKVIQTPGMIEHWLEIYAKSTHSEIPAMEARLKSMDADIESKTKRVQNLVSRIAELPTEIPADPFYDQIKETNQKLSELKLAKKELLSKSISLKGQAIDQNGLIEKIKGITARLEETPIENRRPLYSNLIQFAELHTTKIRVGVIAPTLSPNRNDNQMKATGTDGVPGSFANFESNEGKVLKIAAGTRAGSTSVTIGAPE